MPAKKKTSKKSVVKAEVKAEVKTDDIKEEKYKPLFNKSMVFTRVINKDINYYGIKQYLKNKFNLDFFRRLKENGDAKEEIKGDEEIIKRIKEDKTPFNLKEELNQIWVIYCEYWNYIFNKQVK